MEENMKQTMENAKTLAGAVHDIAHAVAYPMVGEVVKTQSQLTERVGELEADMGSAEGNLKNMMEMIDVAMGKIYARIDEVIKTQAMTNAALSREIHEAVANLTTPDDERIAELEAKMDSENNDMNERMLRVEEQMATIIGFAEKIGQLD